MAQETGNFLADYLQKFDGQKIPLMKGDPLLVGWVVNAKLDPEVRTLFKVKVIPLKPDLNPLKNSIWGIDNLIGLKGKAKYGNGFFCLVKRENRWKTAYVRPDKLKMGAENPQKLIAEFKEAISLRDNLLRDSYENEYLISTGQEIEKILAQSS